MNTLKESQGSGVRSQERRKIVKTPNSKLRTVFHGIRAQLIIGITVVTVGAVALIGFWSIKKLKWCALHRKGKEAETIAAFIQTSIQEGKGIEGNTLKRFIAKVVENGVVKDMAIIDEKGRAIFITGKGLPVNKDAGKQLFFIRDLNIRMIGGGWFEGIGKELMVFSNGGKEGLGWTFMFTMPLSDIREDAANFKKFIIFYALFDSIVIIILGAYIFSKGIIRPMNLLKEAAEGIAGGDLEQRVHINGGGEISSFASSFNIMADRLEEKIKALEKLNEELLTAHEELIRSEKLATVGRLAAGIAHEIGNPLAAILGYVDILKRQEFPPPIPLQRGTKGEVGSQETEEILERLGKEILRIDNIVRGLLDFARPSTAMSSAKGVLQDIDVNEIINHSVAMIQPQFSKSYISFDFRLAKDLPHVRMDGGMLEQVLLNLFLNAKDAMESGGIITVETDKTILQEQVMQLRRRKDDPADREFISMRSQGTPATFVKISVADTGKGIEKEDIDKIFDPFFTTKEQGKGTGLGLAVSLGIVKACGGDIKVSSEVGKGTTFEMLIPIEQEIGKRK